MVQWKSILIPQLTQPLAGCLTRLPQSVSGRLEEIRLRVGKTARVRANGESLELKRENGEKYIPSREDMDRLFARVCDHSVYARGEELSQGYITLRGGYRVGLGGQVGIKENGAQLMKNVSSMNIRLIREVKGCAEGILPHICGAGAMALGLPFSTLIVSPPGQGKTTLLRELARCLSEAYEVCVIDERSEIAGSYLGVPQLDVGPRTDVLDGCPKHVGLRMAVRGLGPQVLITDEIGSEQDVLALSEALRAGVCVIASIHGDHLLTARNRPTLGPLMEKGGFERFALLGNSRGPGTLEQVEDREGRRL